MSDLIKISDFKAKKQREEEAAKGRQPLRVNILNPAAIKKPEVFGDRYNRIKKSLEKINRLMAELKTMSGKYENETN